jgi:outer membrane protein
MKRLLLLTASAAILAGATSANAADLGEVRKPGIAAPAEIFNPWMVRFRAVAVVPDDKSSVFINGGRVAGNGNLNVSNSLIPEVDVTYFFTKNFAVEVIAGVTPHTIKTAGNLAGTGKVGSTILLPPTVTAQYHFWLTDSIKPYVGAGVNYTFFLNEKEKGVFTSFNVKNTWGLALQAGVDVMLSKNWGINIDVKKIFLEPKYTATIGAATVTGKAKLNPWLIGAGVTYKF